MAEAKQLLRRLELGRDRYGADSAASKAELLAVLERARLARPAEILRLHEVLCFLRAYPDDARLLARVERMLGKFARRRDLAAHRAALADSGIAGTEIRDRFYLPSAEWLARRWPARLRVDWERFEWRERLEPFLPLLALFPETAGLDEWDLGLKGWLGRLAGPRTPDGTFLVRRFGALAADAFTRERLYEEIDVPLRLAAGPDTPSRTHARYASSPVVFCCGLARGRPELPADALRTPLAVRALAPREARRLIDLAREAMVTRNRDLDVFSYASPEDVRLVEWEGGLQFACMGAIPERRLLLESVYGFLTLKNGVPLGYVLASALFGSSEIAYNVFDTFRGGEAGWIYGRVLATVRHLFGSDAFTIFPYQLGQNNEEALASGAWWFYQKIGFRPRHPAALARMRRELGRLRRDPAYRSVRDTLRLLAGHNLYYFLGRPREDVIGIVFPPNIGLRITDALAQRFGPDREAATRVLSREAAELLGVRSLRGFSPGERLAWERWAPLVRILPGIERFSAEERRGLVGVVRAKGGRRESEFVRRLDAHRRLRRALLQLAR
ncbi:MAG TPA: hypothetical protein VJS92_08355 [Candidatus Polarisedimenticolaceae bacterium]|nr:hypothetical protein [Candidatus Polarisedimenticolaceae bacterium]